MMSLIEAGDTMPVLEEESQKRERIRCQITNMNPSQERLRAPSM